MSDDARVFLSRHESEVRPLKKQAALAYWQANLTGSDEDYKRNADLELAVRKIYSRRDEYNRIIQWLSEGHSDPAIQRQLVLLRDTYAPYQLDEPTLKTLTEREIEIEKIFNTYRAQFEGEKVTDNHLKRILKESTDSQRCQAAWEAGKQVGEVVAAPLLELIAIRNQAAASLGYSNYYEMRLRLQELDPADLAALVEDLDRRISHPYQTFKKELDRKLAARFNLSVEQLQTWHYGDPFFQEYPHTDRTNFDVIFATKDIEELTRRFFQGIGLPIEPILEASDLYERPGKCQHAFCIGIDTPKDVRILCNIKPNQRWMETTMHEFGHGVYDYYLNPALPWLLCEPAHTLVTEAVAMFTGRMTLHRDWLHLIAGLTESEADALSGIVRQHARGHQLIFCRWAMVMIHFERELYANPVQDLNQLWWELVERYQGIRRPAGRTKPDWASKIHIATAPVYYQNYLLGELYTSHLLAHLQKELNGESIVQNPKTGEFFRRALFTTGRRYDWRETLIRATGEALNPGHWINEFGT